MIGLQVAGVLDKCESLPHHIDIDLLRSMQVELSTVREYLSELYEALADTGDDGRIKSALAGCLGIRPGEQPPLSESAG
jgi:hypothetical protein